MVSERDVSCHVHSPSHLHLRIPFFTYKRGSATVGHMTLSAPFLKEIEKRLKEEEQRLLRDLGDLADEDPKQPGVFLPKPPTDEVETDDDSSIEATTISDSLAVIEGLQEELRDVRKAQRMLKNKTYGLCKYCQKPIDPKRLEARPTSSACITCKKTLTQEL